MKQVTIALLVMILLLSAATINNVYADGPPKAKTLSDAVGKKAAETAGIGDKVKVKTLGTIRGMALMYMPISTAVIVCMFILGGTFESMSYLYRASHRLIFVTIIGLILVFFAEPIVTWFDIIINKLDLTL